MKSLYKIVGGFLIIFSVLLVFSSIFTIFRYSSELLKENIFGTMIGLVILISVFSFIFFTLPGKDYLRIREETKWSDRSLGLMSLVSIYLIIAFCDFFLNSDSVTSGMFTVLFFIPAVIVYLFSIFYLLRHKHNSI
jgi:hypothetical protein